MLFKNRSRQLGRSYADGSTIIFQGAKADNFFIILEGRVEVVIDKPTSPPQRIAILEKGGDDVFGEMSCFDDLPRSATVRALGPARVLSIDRKGILRWMQEDPSTVLQILTKMSKRIRTLNDEILSLRQEAQQNATRTQTNST